MSVADVTQYNRAAGKTDTGKNKTKSNLIEIFSFKRPEPEFIDVVVMYVLRFIGMFILVCHINCGLISSEAARCHENSWRARHNFHFRSFGIDMGAVGKSYSFQFSIRYMRRRPSTI